MAQIMINVCICYALPDQQRECVQIVPVGTTVAQAIRASGILEVYDLSMGTLSVGIYGEVVSLDTVLSSGDRIEIYRPLTIDPKEARRLRALKKKKSATRCE